MNFNWVFRFRQHHSIDRISLALLSAALLIPGVVHSAVPVTVDMQTSKGVIKLELDPDKAPVSVANFLSYANQGFYDGTIFHRVVHGFVMQGGGFGLDLQQKTTQTAIVNEANNGLLNQQYTIAMARTSDPNSATSQFFINLVDNPSLDYPTNGGYAVFGHVVDGTSVVDTIGNVPVFADFPDQFTTLPSVFSNLPLTPVYIQAIVVWPTANPGSNQTVASRSLVGLDGTGSQPGSKPITTYTWSQTAGPTVTLINGDTATPQFLAPAVDTNTDLIFQLIVANGDGKTSSAEPVTVTVTPVAAVPGAPTAVAGVDLTVDPGASVTLDGSASTDPDPGQQASLTYKWTQIGTPKVILTPNDSIASPLFNTPAAPPVNVVLTFALVVKDIDGHSSAPDTVDITVKRLNHAPTAIIKANPTARINSLQTLDGSGSRDPDNDPIQTYQWLQVAGSTAELSNPGAPMPTFTVPSGASGSQFKFSLVVSDGSLQSTPAEVTMAVDALNHAPTVHLGLDKTAPENSAVVLNAEVHDPDGDDVSYLWERTDSGTTPITLGDIHGPSLSFTAPWLLNGKPLPLEFKLTVTDAYTADPKSSSDSIKVLITPNPNALDCAQAVANPSQLWPAKGGMVNVRFGGIAGPNGVDDRNHPYDLKFTAITQDEPVKNRALGDASAPDARVRVKHRTLKVPMAKDSLYLRAQRQGTKSGANGFSGNGRVYRVEFIASDGNDECTGSVTVSVPPSSTATAVDDGQQYDSRAKR